MGQQKQRARRRADSHSALADDRFRVVVDDGEPSAPANAPAPVSTTKPGAAEMVQPYLGPATVLEGADASATPSSIAKDGIVAGAAGAPIEPLPAKSADDRKGRGWLLIGVAAVLVVGGGIIALRMMRAPSVPADTPIAASTNAEIPSGASAAPAGSAAPSAEERTLQLDDPTETAEPSSSSSKSSRKTKTTKDPASPSATPTGSGRRSPIIF